MIFVTVGTTMKFDDLIRQIDDLVGRGVIKENVICQIGNGDYLPKHCEYFRFRPSIDDLIHEADLVISHGGSTVFALLSLQKRCVIMPNKDGADSHQRDLMRLLTKQIDIPWSEDTAELATLIEKARSTAPKYGKSPSLSIDLLEYLDTI